MGNGTLDDHVANVLVDKSYEIDAIMDEKAEIFENKEKAASKSLIAEEYNNSTSGLENKIFHVSISWLLK